MEVSGRRVSGKPEKRQSRRKKATAEFGPPKGVDHAGGQRVNLHRGRRADGRSHGRENWGCKIADQGVPIAARAKNRMGGNRDFVRIPNLRNGSIFWHQTNGESIKTSRNPIEKVKTHTYRSTQGARMLIPNVRWGGRWDATDS